MADTGAEHKIEASSEPQVAKTETELATNSLHGDGAKEESTKDSSASGAVSFYGHGKHDEVLLLWWGTLADCARL